MTIFKRTILFALPVRTIRVYNLRPPAGKFARSHPPSRARAHWGKHAKAQARPTEEQGSGLRTRGGVRADLRWVAVLRVRRPGYRGAGNG